VNGKLRIAEYYEQHQPTDKELAAFLQKEYGIAGHSGPDMPDVGYDSRGIHIISADKKGNYHYSWTQAAKEIRLMIERGEYITPADIDDAEFQKEVKKISDDPAVNGILMLAPLPDGLDGDAAAALIAPEKDIDGIGPVNKRKLYDGDPDGFVPCTAQAVMEVLDYADVDVTGKHVTVVGYGMTVGKPLSIMLLNRKATVSICRSRTTQDDLKKLCSASDIIIAATGRMGMIGPDCVKEGAVVVDVGISMGEDGCIHGDVQYDEITDIAALATPVPGGVGAVTTTILAQQLVRAARLQRA
jgi:methylenetetrahydrofolate dehydrogenase (NADP+)/methenyltetrahydrofolate cyclohydrolase